MRKPVQVAGAVVTGGLLFWPAHAEAPAASVIPAAQVSVAALQLHGVLSTADDSTTERLRLLAQYTADEPASGDNPDSEDGAEGQDSEGGASAEEDASQGEPFGELEPSDAVNEVPVSEPQPTPATWAPEQGERAAEAGGEDPRLKFKVSTGFDYSSGDYGLSENTDILYIPVSGQLDTRSWKFKVTVPWIRIEGPTGVVGGTDSPIIIDDPLAPPLPVVENSGLGDVVASVTYKVPSLGQGAPFIDLTGKVKFPTADRDKFLGTGEYDFTFQADIFQALGDLTLFGGLGYRILGDPDGRDLNNGLLASGGFAYKFSNSFSGGGILDWREASTDTSDDPFEIVPYVVWRVHEDWAVQAYGVFGLSDGSPDAGGGLQISFSFD